MSIVQYELFMPGYVAAVPVGVATRCASFLRMLTLMPSGLPAAWMTWAMVAWSSEPATASNVVVKPFGTVDLAISSLALAMLYWMPGDFGS